MPTIIDQNHVDTIQENIFIIIWEGLQQLALYIMIRHTFLAVTEQKLLLKLSKPFELKPTLIQVTAWYMVAGHYWNQICLRFMMHNDDNEMA